MSTIKVNELSTYSGTDISIETGKTVLLSGTANISGAASQFKMTDVVQGDILYGSAADTLSRLAPGTSGQVLTTAGADANPTWEAVAGGGKVLQVVQGTVLDDTQSTTSASFVDMSPSLTATITPAATTSKILVNFVVTTGANEGWHAFYRIMRDSTAIGIGVANGSRKQATFEVSTGAIAIATTGSMNYLDSPSTTSATVYKIQWATESAGTIYLNRSHTWTDSSNWMTGISTITLMEIGA